MSPLQNRICLTIAGLASLLGLSAAQAMEPDELFEKVSPSVWVVVTNDSQGKPMASGTAVVIAQGRLVTNCHVLAKSSSFTVHREKISFPATLEYPDVERDLCQIKVNNFYAPSVLIGLIDHLRVGQKVYAIGAPRGFEETMSDGMLSSLRTGKDGQLRYIQITAPISHGSSGGGLFNTRGELIGITSAGEDATYAQNINFAVPAQWILELPERGQAALDKPRTATRNPAPIAPVQPKPEVAVNPRIAELSESCQASFKQYLQLPSPRAFAISSNGHCGYAWSGGGGSVSGFGVSAGPRAIRYCIQGGGSSCRTYMVDNEVVDE